jgi:predicted RNA-binding Zn ribbon-like protein
VASEQSGIDRDAYGATEEVVGGLEDAGGESAFVGFDVGDRFLGDHHERDDHAEPGAPSPCLSGGSSRYPHNGYMTVTKGDAHAMRLVGGHPAVDFVNTLSGSKDTPDEEYLHVYGDLLVWSERTGLIDPELAATLARTADRRPQPATTALEAALELRGHVDAILRPTLAGRSPHAADLDAVRRAEVGALSHAALSPQFAWTWTGTAIERPLWPLAHAVIDLLRSTPLGRLGECERCRWLFVDTSANRSRRWCSMNSCGAIEKMRRHRARH